MGWINNINSTNKFYKNKIDAIILLIEKEYKDKTDIPDNIKSALIKLEILKTAAETGWQY